MILVVAEKGAGKLNRASWEVIAAAQQLAGANASLGPITVAIAGHDLGGVASELATAEGSRSISTFVPGDTRGDSIGRIRRRRALSFESRRGRTDGGVAIHVRDSER
jgi:hypothetical protein